MRLAVIDLGTNSARISIHQLLQGEVILLHKEKIRVSLGVPVFKKGSVDFKHLSKTIEAFERFQFLMSDFGVSHLSAVATSALREAQNGVEVSHVIEKKTRIRLQIISGRREAQLIAKGILSGEDLTAVGLIDIGGGSTEISMIDGGRLRSFDSLKLGGLRFQEIYLKSHPPGTEAITKTREQIRQVLASNVQAWSHGSEVLGSGGTIKLIGRLFAAQYSQDQITREKLRALVAKMSVMSLKEILKLKGMSESKAPIILAGAIILEEVMDALKIQRITPTKYNLKDGLLAELIEEHSAQYIASL